MQNRVLTKQEYDVQHHNSHAVGRVFYVGDTVWTLNFQGKPKWLSGVIEQKLGPVTFSVKLVDGRIWRRHQDHLRKRYPDEERAPNPELGTPVPPLLTIPSPPLPINTSKPSAPLEPSIESPEINSRIPEQLLVPPQPDDRSTPSPEIVRRSSRVIKKPARLDL
ncbi:hypothetical protein SNE40_020571 [Patella caerulea]